MVSAVRTPPLHSIATATTHAARTKTQKSWTAAYAAVARPAKIKQE
jgi:hypothetical protein